ncbi:hypothetical protein Slala05_51700 [Streptomyces lavendulae subsp. lavendulae]|nr:hypothetical protein Slala05_51700 [Streptomyces lavendulae subsp. lavendulae]
MHLQPKPQVGAVHRTGRPTLKSEGTRAPAASWGRMRMPIARRAWLCLAAAAAVVLATTVTRPASAASGEVQAVLGTPGGGSALTAPAWKPSRRRPSRATPTGPPGTRRRAETLKLSSGIFPWQSDSRIGSHSTPFHERPGR